MSTEASSIEKLLERFRKGDLDKFKNLPPEARQYFLNLAEPVLRGAGSEDALRSMYAIDYDRYPVSPETFITHSDYCKHIGDQLFPEWRKVFLDVCRPGSGIHELCVTGASGLGKTLSSMLILAYKIYRASCLRNPAYFYGLAARTKIFFGIYATTKGLIKDVGFYDLRDQIIDQSPYFRDVFKREDHGKEYIRWENKGLEVILGSSAIHALGRALFAVIADELNYYAKGDKTAVKAHELVSEVSRRLEGRFIQSGGDIPGIAIYISQTRTTADFLENRIREHKAKNLKGVRVVRGPRWAFNPGGYAPVRDTAALTYVAQTAAGPVPGFRVFTGSETADARILDKVYNHADGSLAVEPLEGTKELDNDGHVIIVPTLHYRAHMDDLYGALRNIDDVPTGTFTPFFPRREPIESAFDKDLPYPFSTEVIACYEKSATQLQDAFSHKTVTRVTMGKHEPLRHPSAPRYIHLDLSISGDRTGFVMVHPSGHYRVERPAQDAAQVGTGEIVKEIEVDFYVALTAGPYGEPIDYRKIRVFIDWLRRCGFWIRGVSADTYNSHDTLQRLREAGFETSYLSVDKTSIPYRDLKQVFNERRIKIPYPTNIIPPKPGDTDTKVNKILLYQELTGLEYDVQSDKVDHRDRNPDGSRGSKDIGDGLSGSVYSALADKLTPNDLPREHTATQKATSALNRYLSAIPWQQ